LVLLISQSDLAVNQLTAGDTSSRPSVAESADSTIVTEKAW
jgi:hypothetical protein